ncbi:VOC family protein [Methylocucumis oryzae]|uniref:VOC family protein n=1 Tax=Methylocucumis oryzae TaxID=1632867 RepID=UPI000A63CBD7|nr:VOC family protein [Methylocucumis oryzae]
MPKIFYQTLLAATFKDDTMADFQFAIFEAEEEAVSGMLVLGEQYQPSSTGAVVYFNGGEDLSVPLERGLQNGATLIVPKTAIHDGDCGYFALILDSEGNRIGLYSPA